ncbi:hypothetical protein CHU92_11230 [Flavobacterium cyanobacteriorum]|uniref:Uncharacterized protein n=1 Tax=Flavobacterium cyanobacteriorum TaxID=2022802 RepID=A0A255Z0Y4_9FLAO|nr:hypothetical protein [Flavobacterium cyanobacteriorum]OYQ35079.1 hypothetical protein CHU92_11230 [Flavobacterium cyanobacteriorum]
MSKYIHGIYALIFIGLISTVVICFHNNDVLEARINTLVKYADADKLNSDKSFKEDYYIQQQEKDTTLILWLVPIIFTSLGIFSFITFEQRLRKLEEDERTKHEKHIENYTGLHKSILDLKSEYCFENAWVNFSKSTDMFYNNNLDWYVHFTITGCKYLSDYIVRQYEVENLKGSKRAKEIIFERLTEVISRISEFNEVKDVEPIVTAQYIKEIRDMGETDINKCLSKIDAKLIKKD